MTADPSASYAASTATSPGPPSPFALMMSQGSLASNATSSSSSSTSSSSSSSAFPTLSAGVANYMGLNQTDMNALVNIGQIGVPNQPPAGDSISGAMRPTTSEQTQATTIQNALNNLENLAQPDVKQLQEQLFQAGYLTQQPVAPGVVDDKTQLGYAHLLLDTARANQAGNPLTASQLLDQRIQAIQATPGGARGSSRLNEQYFRITDPTTAAATLTDALERQLGRKPTGSEISAFTNALNAYNQQNPETVKTAASTTPGMDYNVTRSGGTTPAAFAQQYVNNQYAGQLGSMQVGQALDFLGKMAGHTQAPAPLLGSTRLK